MPATLLLSVEQAAAELHIARRRVFKLIRDGQLVSVKIGRSRRIASGVPISPSMSRTSAATRSPHERPD